jgi:hydrogenase maturation protein HypF
MVSVDNWKYNRCMRAGLTLKISGTVQGVGFRPFVYRLASELKLPGQVYNTTYGVCIELDGEDQAFVNFVDRLIREKPEHAVIKNIEKDGCAAHGYSEFKIGESKPGTKIEAGLLPDLALCEDCRRELFDPADRRYLYPFINCTNCGPRFSIITALPYDRCNTSMKNFIMCPACMAEYHDPGNRRFHAQPNACPECGPHVTLFSNHGERISTQADAIDRAVNLIRQGGSIAVKGIGGFHIMCRADSPDAIRRLREKKHRPAKPLALLFPDLKHVSECCIITDAEQRLLLSAAHPIVLLRKKEALSGRIHESVAPDNPYRGVMLPYAPLQHVLMQKLGQPVIATSANLVDETICIADEEVFSRLTTVVDAVLSHDRPIVRHADDSIARIFQDEPIVLRGARGYTGALLQSKVASAPALVALGGAVEKYILN